MKIIVAHIFFCFCLFGTTKSYGQDFQITLKGSDAPAFQQQIILNKKYNDELSAQAALQAQLLVLYKKGYLAAAIDTITTSGNNLIAQVYLGQKYEWAQIRTSNIPSHIIQLSGFNENDFYKKPLNPNALNNVLNKMISYYENNGYPFAGAQLDSLSFNGGQVSAHLDLNRGPLIKIDTIILNEDAGISKDFLEKYIGIREGDLYNEKKMRNISNRIKEISFLEESFPWKMNFTIVKNTLKLFVKSKNANRADVLIGLLPNNAEIGNKFLLTGDVKLAFMNALGQGEQLQFNWQNLQFQSPRLNINAQYPYILNSQIGLSGTFDYYKKDTTFRTVNGELGFVYQFSAQEEIKAYYQTGSSRLIFVNVPQLISTQRLPENADYQLKTFGLEGNLNRVDYRLNPRKGWQAKINGSASIRDFIKNSTIEDTEVPNSNLTYAYLYDSLALRAYRFQVFGSLAYYFPVGKRIVIQPRYNFGQMYSVNPLYRNEVFQIGGFRLLRGFDEGSLFVNSYHLGTIETRYLISQNSYFFLFSDVGTINRNYPGINRRDNPYSLGLGMVFETRAGLFNLSYAAGTLGDTGIKFSNSKIHFGYINYF